jgi:4-hydroxybenzoate decarboxylase
LIERGEFRIVDREVDGRFELASVVARSQAESARPILFRKVRGSTLPVVCNVFGSAERMCELIGAENGRLCQRWAAIMKSVDTMQGDYVRLVTPPPLVRGSIADLPHITWREKDAGPYITAGVFLAKHPDTGIPNLSFCRTMMSSDSKLVCCIDAPHDLAQYQACAEARSQALEVAILIAPPPAVFIAACASVPIDVDELKIASAIEGRPLEMRACDSIALDVPRDTQIVIEGRIRPGVREPEGPFGEYLGYYGPRQENGYVIDVQAVSWQPDAVFHGLLCGSSEDLTALDIAFATRTYTALASSMPGILDVTCNPMLYCSVVKIDKTYEGQAQHVILKTFAANPNYNFACIVVDRDIDIRNLREVLSAFLTRGRIDKRVMVIPDVPGWDRSPVPNYAGRLGIDATMPLGKEVEFEKARTPGAEGIRLADYFGDRD